MESDLPHHHHFFHGHHQKQMNPGLTRYQSAPSSYLCGFLDREFCEEFLNRPTSPETERIFARFLASSGGNTENVSNQNFGLIKQDSPVREAMPQVNQQAQILASVNSNDTTRLHQQQQQQTNYSVASQGFYQNSSKPPLPDKNSGCGMDYRMATSMGMERLPQMKSTTGGSNSNLVRHSSSPAGLFSNINVDVENGILFFFSVSINFIVSFWVSSYTFQIIYLNYPIKECFIFFLNNLCCKLMLEVLNYV